MNADLYLTVLFTKTCVIGRDRNSVHERPRFVLAFILQQFIFYRRGGIELLTVRNAKTAVQQRRCSATTAVILAGGLID